MSFGSNILVNGAGGVALTATGYVNPDGSAATTGFEVQPGTTVLVSAEGTYTGVSLVFSQTLDPNGVSGWFPVYAVSVDGALYSGSTVAPADTTSVAFAVPVVGVRMRVRVNAITGGSITVRVNLTSGSSSVIANTAIVPTTGGLATQVQGAIGQGASSINEFPVLMGGADGSGGNGNVRTMRVDGNGNAFHVPVAGGTAVNAASGNVANAQAVATLTSAVGSLLYIEGFTVTAGGATTGLIVNVTVTGLIGGTATFAFGFPAGVLVAATPLVVTFPAPIPASATNTNIVVTLPAGGTGNTNASVNAFGFRVP